MTLFGCSYSYRIKAVSLFDEGFPTKIFDIFLLNDKIKLDEIHLFENLWRETLLLSRLHKNLHLDIAMPVLSFGQLPNKIIYREIQEINGKTLDDYIEHNRIKYS